MEDGCIDLVIGQGPGAQSIRLDLQPFTLVGATTRTGLLTTPLRDRFGITHRLDYYRRRLTSRRSSPARRGSSRSRSAPAGCREIARRSRGTPRMANRILRRVRDFAEVRADGVITDEVAIEALELFEVDEIGLERVDRAILRSVAETFSGGPVGLSTLAVAIGEEADTLEDVYEPYLIQRGLLKRTPRGRVVTPAGYGHLGPGRAGRVTARCSEPIGRAVCDHPAVRIHRQWFLLTARIAGLPGRRLGAMGVSRIETASRGPAFQLRPRSACASTARPASSWAW